MSNVLTIVDMHKTYAGGVHAVRGVSFDVNQGESVACLLYTSPSPRDATLSRMPSSA